MDPFATLDELKARLDWTLTPDEERTGTAALEDASDLARGYGRDWEGPTTAPRLVRTLVLAACQRYMRNPDAYTQSRAGDEHLAWADTGKVQSSPAFTEEEIALIGQLAGDSKAFGSVGVSAWGPMRDTARYRHREGYVPVYEGGKYMPMFQWDDSPWGSTDYWCGTYGCTCCGRIW